MNKKEIDENVSDRIYKGADKIMENDYQEVAEKAKTYPEYKSLMNISKNIRVNTLANYFNYDDIETIQTSLLKKAEQEIELGCPIEVVLKALKRHIKVTKEYSNIGDVCARCLIFDGHDWRIMTSGFKDVYTKDYKKTWWLKEDKSE